MPFKKGQSGNPKGRKPGPTKVTLDVREAIKRAFDKLGGEKWLATLGETDPKAFSVLLAKIVPAKIEAEVSVLDRMTDDDRSVLERGIDAILAAREAGVGETTH